MTLGVLAERRLSASLLVDCGAMPVKRIVLLANSRKLSGRCLAGKEQIPTAARGPWVRPVSDRAAEELSEEERQYQDGTDPRVLDIIDVPLRGHRPKAYQSENWVIDPDKYWVRAGRAKWKDLAGLADKPNTLWTNGNHTYNGLNDRVGATEAAELDHSLFLLHLDQLKIHVFAPGATFNNPKRRVQASFSTAGVDYSLWVTDPIIERIYLAGDDGEFAIGECFVTVSLGEPNSDGFCYKLVAAIVTPDGVGK
jgi:hypothetical protein